LHYPDARLHTVAKPVAAVDERIRTLVDDMAETMYAAPGIGLAATQVNVHERVVVIDISETHDQLRVFINPEIVAASGTEESEEGCLSVPGVFDKVTRAERDRARARPRRQAVRTRSRRPAGGVHPARARSPEGQGLRRLPVQPQTQPHQGPALEAGARAPPDAAPVRASL
jgi:peptide deformylase